MGKNRSRRRLLTLVASVCLVAALTPPARGASSVAQLLERVPTDNAAEFEDVGKALVALGPAGVRELAGRLGEEPQDAKVCFALHGLVDYAGRPGAEAERTMVAEALCDVLRSDAPAAAKSYALNELRLVGKGESVGATKALLSVGGLCEPAAQTLVSIGTPGALEALRSSAQGLGGKRRLTVLYALGRSRDRGAVALLTKEARGKDAAVRRAAVYALANIGAPEAADVLREAAKEDPERDNKALALFGSSAYSPKVRSPKNINLLKEATVGSFVLDMRALSTNKEYGHRDLCFFFGYQDPSHFYYAHIASKADAHAHSIFLVDGKPRVSIATSRTKGVTWDDQWHAVRIVRDADTGKIEVYFDDMSKPIMIAEDKHFTWGRVGVGSFDDTGMFDDIRLRGDLREPGPPPSSEAAAPAAVEAAGADGGVKITELEDVVRVELGGALLTEYHYKDADRPYFYPVIGPTGVNVTRDWPMKEGDEAKDEQRDHKHHRGLWFTHGAVNGHDFWSEGRGPRIAQNRIVRASSDRSSGVIETESTWVTKDGTPICTDRRRHIFHATSAGAARMMDIEITLRATHGKLVLGDTKEGSMAVRVAPTMRVKGKVGRGHLVTSEGRRDGQAWGKRARWCDAYGPVNGNVVGIAIFDHPSNPRHPTWWHARTYGLVAANPFGVHYFEKKPAGAGDLTVPDGEEVRFRYRILVHAGDEKEGEVEKHYRAFADEKRADVTEDAR